MTIHIDDVAYSYEHDRPLLQHVTFAVEQGSTCCLLGPNGAGKTTLIRCLVGLAKPSSGAIHIGNLNVTEVSPPQLAREVAYVPQSVETAFALTALDMVLTGRTPYVRFGGTPTKDDHDIAHESLNAIGVGHLVARPFNELSGGERQLVTIARALAQRTPVIVLDEPTSALDFGNQVRVLQIVRELADSGKAILMTSHAPNHALDGADQVVLLKNGSVVAAGNPDDVIDGPTLSDLYGVAVTVVALGPQKSRRVCVPDISTQSRQMDSGQRSVSQQYIKEK